MSNPPELLQLMRRLDYTWIDLANFLGYSDNDPEIKAIFANAAPPVRFQMFMRFCLIPDCGQMNSKVVLCLKESLNYDSQSQVFQQHSGNLSAS